MERTSLCQSPCPSPLPERLKGPFETALRTVVQQAGAAGACLALYDEPAALFVEALHTGLSASLLKALSADGGPAKEALNSGRSLLVTAAADGACGSALAKAGLSHILVLPLRNDSYRHGVLCALGTGHQDSASGAHMLLNGLAGLVTAAMGAERISQEQHRAVEQALAASRAKSNFLASMSHEIRTPLNGILGMLSLLKQTRLTLEQQEYLDVADSSGNALLGLLNDILDISKIEAGKLELEQIDFDLRHSIEELLETMATRAHEKNLELASVIFASVPTTVRGDPTRLRQVLANLLSNALKFTEQGEIVVTVFPIEGQGTDVLLGFEVRDTGIGIAKEGQAQIFRAFEQAEGSTTRRFGGTGLGLAISKQLAEYMGGEIGVESEHGNGSTFWFTARLGKSEARPKEAVEPVDLSRLRALVVDNHPTSCAALEQMFLSWGMRYEGVARGEEALETLRRAARDKRPFDLVIMEMALPDMTGIELGARIDASSDVGSPRKMMLTNYGRRGDANAAREAGLQAYITRPVLGSQLRDGIARVMGLKETNKDVLITKHSLSESGVGERYRVLLAEDDTFNQKVALGMLKKIGIRADVAANGVDAVEAVINHRYDIVLMDCQMPEMDGFEATAAIREQEKAMCSGVRLPIVAMTANALQGDRERCLDAGMDDYIAKPVQIEQLKDTLQQWLPARAEASTPPAARPVPGADHPALTGEPLDGPTYENLRLALGAGFGGTVEIYLNDAHQRVADIATALEAGDMRGLMRAAHTLKSASRYLGVLPLADLCFVLEHAAESGELTTAASVAALIQPAFDRAEAALQSAPDAAAPAS
jgi:two-component system sensor histidine kinase/response regulator